MLGDAGNRLNNDNECLCGYGSSYRYNRIIVLLIAFFWLSRTEELLLDCFVVVEASGREARLRGVLLSDLPSLAV